MLIAPVDNDIWVEVGPIIRADNFKTRNAAVVWNESGLAGTVLKGPVTGSGTTVALSIGSGDWSHKARGVYRVKIPTAQNNTLGQMRVEMDLTDMLPFGSPEIQIVPQDVYDSFVAGTIPFPGNEIIVGPLIGSTRAENFIGDPLTLAIFKGEAKIFVMSVTDAAGDPVDMSAMTLRCTVENIETDALVSTADQVIVTGAGDDVANIYFNRATSLLISPGEYKWRLWDDVGDDVLLHGTFIVGGTSES